MKSDEFQADLENRRVFQEKLFHTKEFGIKITNLGESHFEGFKYHLLVCFSLIWFMLLVIVYFLNVEVAKNISSRSSKLT